jgi:very-short-patch-repair endonuclease
VVVEYDGDQHRADRGQFERDVERLEDLAREGWTVVRVLAHHLRSPLHLQARVRAALRAGGWRP